MIRALTLHQPWASLTVAGVKTIETRSWSTKYRGPLAIHAGKRYHIGAWPLDLMRATDDLHGGIAGYPETFPRGAVIGTVNLVDCVPMVDGSNDFTEPCLVIDGPVAPTKAHPSGAPGTLTRYLADVTAIDADDQGPLGHFEPGRYAWILESATQFETPVPAKGMQGLWLWDDSRF